MVFAQRWRVRQRSVFPENFIRFRFSVIESYQKPMSKVWTIVCCSKY